MKRKPTNISEEKHKKLKIQAAKEERSMEVILDEALDDYFDKKKNRG